jgi:hypothetical protein
MYATSCLYVSTNELPQDAKRGSQGDGPRKRHCVSLTETIESKKKGKGTYRNKALASPKPSASANTASLEAAPKSLRANIARYRSNKGSFVFNNAVRKSGIDWGRDEGAGSIVGKSGLGVSSTLTLGFLV